MNPSTDYSKDTAETKLEAIKAAHRELQESYHSLLKAFIRISEENKQLSAMARIMGRMLSPETDANMRRN